MYTEMNEVKKEVYHLPLSYAQKRLWFVHQLDPESSGYNMRTLWRLRGLLNIGILEQSFQEIVTRHEVLRTTFTSKEGHPVQVIEPDAIFTLNQIDFSGKDNGEERALQWVQEEANRPFDLIKGPLFRVTLLRLGEADHLLLISMHHIISDGWSMGVFAQEFSLLYDAFLHNRPSPLPELPIQYGDFAIWQQEWLQGEKLEQLLTYWKQKLDGVPVLQLPTDFPRPAIQRSAGSSQEFQLSKKLTQALKQLSREEGTTLYMTLLSAFKVLLHRYTQQGDIPVGTPIANRNRSEIEGLIGFFVNTLVLRTDLSGEINFRELLRRVKRNALDAYAHQDLPFEKLVEELQPERDLSHSPLFQVFFAMPNLSDDTIRLSRIEMEPVKVDVDAALVDLSLTMVEEEGQINGMFVYNTDLFEGGTIRRMVGHLETLLEGMIAQPDQSIERLPILTEREHQQLLVEWNKTEKEYPKGRCIHHLFEEQVDKAPNEIAVVCGKERFTYLELNQRANQLAHYLRSQGITPGKLVGLCVDQSVERIIGLLGILKAGGAYVPLDPVYPPERLAFMLSDAKVSFLVTQEEYLERLPIDQVKVIRFDRDEEEIGRESIENIKDEQPADSLAYVIYTSGSTGQPKGVMIEHQGVVNLSYENKTYFTIKPRDRILQFASFSFDGSVFEMFTALLSGASLYLFRKEHDNLGEFLTKNEISFAAFPPSVLATLQDSDVADLRVIIVAGEKCPQDVVNRFIDRENLYNSYGPSETTVAASIYQFQSGKEGALIGQPIANTELYVLDSNLKPVPIGVPGELYIGGVGLARGYLNRPELTAEHFIPHPFRKDKRLYKTGDLVRFHEDGNLEFLDRIDHQVKLRGFRIELGEVEAVLMERQDIQTVVAVVREDPSGSQGLVAYLVPTMGRKLQIPELREYVKHKLPDYMVPASWVIMDDLPLLPNRKVDRNRLPAPDWIEREGEYVAPQTQIEKEMAQIWQEVLGIEEVGIHDLFFTLGGHSLKAMHLISMINKKLGLSFTVTDLFRYPTIHQLSSLIDQRHESKEEGILVPMKNSESSDRQLFLIHPQGGNILCYIDLIKELDDHISIYGLQSQGYGSTAVPLKTVEEMADTYLKEIKRVQPKGPYHLLGWSFGGYVVVEIARILEEEGESISFLGIIDAPAEDIKEVNSYQKSELPLYWYAGLQLGIVEENIHLPEKEGLERLISEAKVQGKISEQTSIQEIMKNAEIMKLNEKAIYAYQFTGKLKTDFHIFYAAEKLPQHRTVDPQEWLDMTEGAIHSFKVQGNHNSMLTPPHVTKITAQVNKNLRKG